jgi:hypothetical protein
MTPPKVYWERMNQRERRLVLLVGGVIFILINLFLWNWLFNISKRERAELAARRATRKEQAIFLKDKNFWTKRDQWVQAHLPPLKNSAEASTFLDQLKQAAAKHNILIENPAIGSGETTPLHQGVFASIETKSPWPPLVQFLYEVQQPDAFVVFDSVNLEIDRNDATLMRGKFKIAKWFASAQKRK